MKIKLVRCSSLRAEELWEIKSDLLFYCFPDVTQQHWGINFTTPHLGPAQMELCYYQNINIKYILINNLNSGSDFVQCKQWPCQFHFALPVCVRQGLVELWLSRGSFLGNTYISEWSIRMNPRASCLSGQEVSWPLNHPLGTQSGKGTEGQSFRGWIMHRLALLGLVLVPLLLSGVSSKQPSLNWMLVSLEWAER